MTFRERITGYGVATIVGVVGGSYVAFGLNRGPIGVVAALIVFWLGVGLYELRRYTRSSR